MQVANRKTCDGIETYVLVEQVWIRLSDLPALLRMMPARLRNSVLQDLEHLEVTKNRGLVEKPLRTWSPAEPVTA